MAIIEKYGSKFTQNPGTSGVRSQVTGAEFLYRAADTEAKYSAYLRLNEHHNEIFQQLADAGFPEPKSPKQAREFYEALRRG